MFKTIKGYLLLSVFLGISSVVQASDSREKDLVKHLGLMMNHVSDICDAAKKIQGSPLMASWAMEAARNSIDDVFVFAKLIFWRIKEKYREKLVVELAELVLKKASLLRDPFIMRDNVQEFLSFYKSSIGDTYFQIGNSYCSYPTLQGFHKLSPLSKLWALSILFLTPQGIGFLRGNIQWMLLSS